MDNELSKPVAWDFPGSKEESRQLGYDFELDDEQKVNCDPLYSQEYVSSLLAELEASRKSNTFLKEQLSKLANFNPDWDMLEACRESWREVAAALKEAEDKLATPVRLPEALFIKVSGTAVPVMHADRVKERVCSAGFTVEGD